MKGPYVKNVTMDSITILWETDTSGPSQVIHGKTYNHNKSVEGYSEEVKPLGGESFYMNNITIEGLSPATAYHYQITSLDEPTPDLTFKTAVQPGEPFVFVVYGDNRPWAPLQDTIHKYHQDVVDAIIKIEPDIVLNTGDIVNNGFFQLEWDMLFMVLEPLIISTPYYPAFGNHETGGADYFNAYFPAPSSAEGQTYYSFDYGNSHFIILDNYIDYKTSSHQYLWLESELKEASKDDEVDFSFVSFHEPPYTASKAHESNLKIRETLCPLFERYDVDVVFNGHNHNYERTVPINGVTYVVTGGGGAPLYEAGSNEWTAYSESTYHFIKADVTGDEVSFEAIRPSGEVFDSFTIQ